MVCSKFAFLLVLSFSSIHCQLSIIWKGATVTDPVLIFHDEVSPTAADTANALSCVSSGASWYFPNGTALSFVSSRQTSVDSNYQVRLSDTEVRLVRNISLKNPMNGLWSCRLNGVIITVGIYQEEGEYGVITRNQVSLALSSFMDDPPTFTLTGETRGGPPTMYNWTRDNEEIMNNNSFSISISLKDVPERFIESVYVSTLVVTGYFPGVYQYAVTNRAMTDVPNQSINIEGGRRVTGLTAEQVEVVTVLISWTAPSPAPARGYRITTSESEHIEIITANTSYTLTLTQLGDHTITVQPLSEHYPSETMSIQAIVRGITSPVITTLSLDDTSVNVHWSLKEFSFPIREYTVSLTRVTGSGQEMCPLVEDNRPAVTTTGNSMSFSSLEEFRTYTVTITAIYDVFNTTSMASATEEFTTLSAVPRKVTISSTPTSIIVMWDPIDCIERNGNITHYQVVLQKLDGTAIPGEVAGRKFTAINLAPDSNYTFQVAGVNDAGTGPFVDLVVSTGTTTRMDVLSLTTIIGIAISVAVLFGVLGFTVGMLAGICKNKRKEPNTHNIEVTSISHAVPIEPNEIPEYEEINLCEINVELKDNTAYNIKSVVS